MFYEVVLDPTAPPGHSVLVACYEHTVSGQMTVGDGVGGGMGGMGDLERKGGLGMKGGLGGGSEWDTIEPHLHGESGLCQRLLCQCHRLFHRRRTGRIGGSGEDIGVERQFAYAFFQLVVEQTAGHYMVVATGPFAISCQCSPTAMTATAIVCIGGIAFDSGGSTLPQHGVGSIPSCTELKLFQIGIADVAAVDIDDVEEQSCSP